MGEEKSEIEFIGRGRGTLIQLMDFVDDLFCYHIV
jgi:hypothetical protein